MSAAGTEVHVGRERAAGAKAHPPVALAPLRWTVLVATVALVASAWEPLAAALALDRSTPLELWRFATCHLTHWSFSHTFWDVMMFAALGAVLEPRSRRLFLCCIGLSAGAISLAVVVWLPDIGTYRGLSGVDSALFCLAVGLLLNEARTERRWRRFALVGLAGAGFVGKVLFEWGTGQTLFVDSHDFVPLPLAHAVGAAVGVSLVWWGTREERRSRPQGVGASG